MRWDWGEGNVDRDLSLTLRDFVGLRPPTSLPARGGACKATKKSVFKQAWHRLFCHFAESEGFEPPVPFSTTVFKTAAIDHSANSPKGNAKILIFFKVHNFSSLS